MATYGGLTGGDTTAVFRNIRLLTNGVAGDDLVMASNTAEPIDFQLMSFTNINGLAVSNIGADGIPADDDVDVFRIGANSVLDFAHSPTVNGRPLSTGGTGGGGIVTNATVQINRLGTTDTGSVTGGQIQLDLANLPTGDVSSVTGGNGLTNRSGNTTGAVILDIDNPYTPPTGIQRITTSLPQHSYRVVNSATETYWIVIETDTAVQSDITVVLHGESVANLNKSDASNLHLGTGENLFTFTLGTNQRTSWNANTHSTTPGVAGFEIRDGSTVIEHIHDQNQFFVGRGEVKEVAHFLSPDRTQTGTISIDNLSLIHI